MLNGLERCRYVNERYFTVEMSEASVSFLFMQEMLHKPQAKIIIYGEFVFVPNDSVLNAEFRW